MTILEFIGLIALMTLGFGIYSCYDKLKKIKCLYEARDKSVEIKWVKREAEEVKFGDKKFRILPQFVHDTIERGGIHILLPTRAGFIRYNWASIYPASPDNTHNAEIVDDAIIDTKETVKELQNNFNLVKELLEKEVEEDDTEVVDEIRN